MTIGREVSSSSPALIVRTQGFDRSLEPGRSYSIGRNPESDIVVEEARVSWRHAVLRLDGSTWLLEDVGSTNGTFVGARGGEAGADRRRPGRAAGPPGRRAAAVVLGARAPGCPRTAVGPAAAAPVLSRWAPGSPWPRRGPGSRRLRPRGPRRGPA